MRLFLTALALLLCVAVGVGCGTSPRKAGEPCSVAADCQSPLICRGLKCDDAINQKCLGQSCDTQKDCAYVRGSLSICGSGTGPNEVTCDRFNHMCGIAKELSDGQVCTAGSQCKSGLCDNNNGMSGWCTRSCTTDALCPSLTRCVKDKKGLYRCLAVCSSQDDCEVYNPNDSARAVCADVTTRDGARETVCL